MNHFRITVLVLALLTAWPLSACSHKQPKMFGRQQAMIYVSTPLHQLFPVKKNGRWGYIDREGQIAIEPQFDDVGHFSEGLAAVGFGSDQHRKWGYVNTAGQIVIEPAFDEAYSFSEGLALVSLKGMYGYIDAKGQVAIEPQFDFSHPFSDGFALVTTPGKHIGPITLKNRKQFYIDKRGNKLGNLDFDDAYSFSDGLASVSINGKYGCINTAGQFVIPTKFDKVIGSFSEGLAPLLDHYSKADYWGYIDKAGQIVIKPQYDEAHQFSEGLAAVKRNGKFSYIDRAGKGLVVSPQFYPLVDDFRHGLAKVNVADRNSASYYNPKFGYINNTGKFIWPPTN
jgi:predicted DNA-binding WGR domain protein